MSVNFDPEDLESRERYSYRSIVAGADTAQAVVNPDGSLIGSGGGTTTANQGTPASAANAWPTYITVGGVAIDPRLIRALTSSDVVTVVQALGTSLHVNVDNFPATQTITGSVSVSNFPATQPISAVSLPLPTNAAQETGGNLATINTNTRIPSSITSFQQTVGTVEVTLPSNAAKSIGIKAPSTNTNPIYVGTTGVTSSTGYILSPGDGVGLDITNTNLVHAISTASAQTLTILVTT